MARFDPKLLPPELARFFAQRHLATLTVLAPDGSPRVSPVGFTYDADGQIARVITWADSWKARHVAAGHDPRASICSVDGRRWATLYGTASVTSEPQAVTDAVQRYATRYRQPQERDDRVVIEVAVNSIVGNI